MYYSVKADLLCYRANHHDFVGDPLVFVNYRCESIVFWFEGARDIRHDSSGFCSLAVLDNLCNIS